MDVNFFASAAGLAWALFGKHSVEWHDAELLCSGKIISVRYVPITSIS
jgi:hypothetical protein